MQLRAHTRLPGRYREDDVPPPPGTAKFVHPTTPYNPNLPPAAFPTLDVPRPVALPPYEVMDVDGSESSNSTLEEELPQRPAAVFRVNGNASRIWSSEVVEHTVEEEVERPELEACSQPPWPSVPSEDRGDFEASVLNIEDEGQNKNARVGLPAYELLDDWKHINNGLKLVILSEMMKNHSFKRVIEILILSNEEIEEIYNLHEQEALRQAEEDTKIGKAQARQLKTLMRGTFATNRDRISTLFADDVFATLKPPDMFVFSKKDVQQAQRFLNNLNLSEYGDRIWRYQGVAMVPNLVCMRTTGLSTLFWSSGCPSDRLHLQALQPSPRQNTNGQQLNSQTANSRKRKQPHPSGKQLLSASQGRKKPRTGSRIVKMKMPASSLRNMVTAEEQEVGTAMAPVRGFSPVPPPDHLTPKLPETPKGSSASHVRFKSLSNKLSPLTSPPRQVAASAAPGLSPDREQIPWSHDLATENQVNNWLSSPDDPCSPFSELRSVTSTTQITSKQPELQLSSAKTQLAQFESANIQVTFAKVDTTPSNSTWLRIAPLEAQSTHSRPPESPEIPEPPKISEPQLSFSETLTMKSKSGEQQRPLFEVQRTPSEPSVLQVSCVEAGMILSESPQVKSAPFKAGLTLSKPLLLYGSPEEAQFTSSKSSQQHMSLFEAKLPSSKVPELQKSPIRPQLKLAKPLEIPLSSAEKRFAMVAKRLAKTAVVSAMNGMPIELSTPTKAPSIYAPLEMLAEKTPFAQENAQTAKSPQLDHVVSPASPDPLTGEAQTRKPVKKLEPAFLVKTLGKVEFGNLRTTTKEPVTPTKKPLRVEATQKPTKSFTKSLVKSMNGITKKETTTKAAPLNAREQVPIAASTNAAAKALDKDMRTKAATAKLKGAEFAAQMSQTKNMIDMTLPNENELPYRKRKQLHHPNDGEDL